jgi:DnaK suppressor protein
MDFDHFETILLDRRKSLVKDVQGMEREEAGTAGHVSGSSIHSAEFGSDRSARDVSLGCMESVASVIHKIDDALERVREGTFGKCDTCGEKISKDRLSAIPYARLCFPCKLADEAL